MALWSVVPTFWIIEQDGPSREDEDEDNEIEYPESEATGYGAVETSSDSGRK